MTDTELELPQGWVLGRISDVVLNPKNDIVDGPFGSNLKSTEYVDQGIPIIRLQNVSRHQFINKNIRYVTKEKAEQLKRHSFLKNDIVMTKLGVPVGKACLVPEFLESGIIVADILRMRVAEKFISKQFILYLINSNFIIKQFAYNTKGTTRPRVNLTKFRNFLIPIPPLNEQKRIVSKIEELFSKIDSAKQSLEHTKLQLEQYRQSLLKSAFDGKLTEKWRIQNIHLLGNFETSLNKIKIQRKNTDFNFKELVQTDKNFLAIPSSWVTIYFQNLQTYGINGFGKRFSKQGISTPVIRLADLKNGQIITTSLREIKMSVKEQEKFVLQKNDLLCIRVNGNENLVGRMNVYNSDLKLAFADHMILCRLDLTLTTSLYIFYLFNSRIIRNQIKSKMVSTAGQNTISQASLKSIILPLPPLSEQEQIISLIEQGFSLIQNTSQIVNSTLQNLQTMKISILKQAFEGKLVPQDPNDEPASVLLERIKSEKS